MGIIMERNKEGEVTLPNASIKIPKNMTALSMLAMNRVVDHGEYREDGWIYVNDKRIKKWFQRIYPEHGSNTLIWLPVLKDIPKLEARMWRMRERYNRYANEAWRPAYNRVVEVKQAHAKPTFHKDKGWWLYTSRIYQNDQYSIGFDWVDEDEPETIINQTIGQAYYDADHKLTQYGHYLFCFRGVLEAAINKLLREGYPPKNMGTTLRLIVNNRNYWYISCSYPGGNLYWNKVSWPDADMEEIIL